jgi:hypothetical protein
MAKQQHINTFTNGMSQDKDPQIQEATTYWSAFNGRVVYNQEGTLSFQNAKGNKFALNITSGYMIVGHEECQDYLIILSTNGYYSEIGFIKEDQFDNAYYQVCFNDAKDPSTPPQFLNFSLKHQIKISCWYDSESNLSIYFDDDVNEPRSFNILAGKDNNWWASTSYPYWYSVASMTSVMDFHFDLPLYSKTISGSLISGQVQYCYRLVSKKTGYNTPYTPPTQLITIAANSPTTNWTDYNMGASGVVTGKGIELVLNNVDDKYDQLELVAIYWADNTAPQNAYVCQTVNITNGTTQYTVQHTSPDGAAVNLVDITQTFPVIDHAKTNAIFDNVLHIMNTVEKKKVAFDASNVTVYPATRNMLAETTAYPTTTPFTNQSTSNQSLGHADTVKTMSYVTNAGVIKTRTHTMDNEYYNYKGTQWEHLFKSYWRKEKYPFAIVFYDMKGQPMYANHIGDITMPVQFNAGHSNTPMYIDRASGQTTQTHFVDISQCIKTGTYSNASSNDSTFKLTKYDASGGTYPVTDDVTTAAGQTVMQNLGLVFDNIDVTDILRNHAGALQISGFSIVRMPRYKNILFQGAYMNVIDYGDSQGNVEQHYDYPYSTNPSYTNILDRVIVKTPELAFNPALPIQNSTNSKLYVNGAIYNPLHDVLNYYPFSLLSHTYAKAYRTQIIDATSGGSNRYYAANINSGTYIQVGQPFAFLTADSSGSQLGVNQYSGAIGLLATQIFSSQGSVVIPITSTIETAICVNSGQSNPAYPAYPSVNYELGIGTPAITQTELENRIYNNIGHFVPINSATIADCTTGGRVVFNGVEVWGGDCYPDLFDECRLVPFQNNSSDINIARGIVFPCESSLNFQLRTNETIDNQYARVATWNVYPPASFFPDGIVLSNHGNRYESFSINSVLQAADNWYDFFPKPAIEEKTDFPLLHRWSNQKITNETIDSFRVFLPNNYNNVNGAQGEIIRCEPLFNYLYILQTNGFCRARFQDRTLVPTTQGQLGTGTGIGCDGYDYISREDGVQQQFAFCKGFDSFYFINSYKGRFLRFAQDGLKCLSDYGMHNWFANKTKDYWKIPKNWTDPNTSTVYEVLNWSADEGYNYIDNSSGIDYYPYSGNQQAGVGGINLCYDKKNNSVLIAFSDVWYALSLEETFQFSTQIATKETLEYSETLNKFVGFHGFYPNQLMSYKNKILMNYSPMNGGGYDLEALYYYNEGIRGSLFNQVQQSQLSVYVAPELGMPKYFDNAYLNVNQSAVSLLNSVTANTQNLSPQTIVLNNPSVDNRPTWKEGFLRYPIMTKRQAQRIRDKYVRLDYVFDNDGSDTLIDIPSHKTDWRESNKH